LLVGLTCSASMRRRGTAPAREVSAADRPCVQAYLLPAPQRTPLLAGPRSAAGLIKPGTGHVTRRSKCRVGVQLCALQIDRRVAVSLVHHVVLPRARRGSVTAHFRRSVEILRPSELPFQSGPRKPSGCHFDKEIASAPNPSIDQYADEVQLAFIFGRCSSRGVSGRRSPSCFGSRAARCRTGRRQHAHITESRIILYRWHPWYRRSVFILSTSARGHIGSRRSASLALCP
jgi:hypothetical protein